MFSVYAVKPADGVEEQIKDEKTINETESPKQEIEVKEIKNETTSNGSSITHHKDTSEEVGSTDSGKVKRDRSEGVDPGNQTIANVDKVKSKSHDICISGSESHDISHDEECVTEPESHVKSPDNVTGDSTVDREGEAPFIELANEETGSIQNGESAFTDDPRDVVSGVEDAEV